MNSASSSSTNGRIPRPPLPGQRRSNSEDLLREDDTEDEEAIHGSAGELLIPPIYDRSRYLGPHLGLWIPTDRRRTRASTVAPEIFQIMRSNRPMNLHQNGRNGTNGVTGLAGLTEVNGTNGGTLPPTARTR